MPQNKTATEILAPSRAVIPFRDMPTGKSIALTLSATLLLGVFMWSFGQFFQIRGVVHMLTSRIFLAISFFSLALLLCGGLRIFGVSGKVKYAALVVLLVG